ncbi:ATPK synthase, partial [Corythaixoides concolor]|nr:ATPK synthase [Corythaixoides concolor]
GPLSERHLMDVRLGELPAWLATRDLSLQGLCGGAQKAWSSYYDKYINVKRGGPAGISMLLAGYCLLSYGWNYQHISKISFLVSV